MGSYITSQKKEIKGEVVGGLYFRGGERSLAVSFGNKEEKTKAREGEKRGKEK